MDKSLLIVGVDPGTTLGYALLDIDGNLIGLRSSKELELNSLISEIIKQGHPVLVGTDRKELPGFVSRFGTKIGAKIVMPEEDMPVGYKKSLTREHSRQIKDEHQRDALASAIFAYKRFKPLISKIDIFIEKNHKESLRADLINLVIKNNISMKYALEILEKPDIEENRIIKRAVKENRFDADFLGLYDRLKRLQKENLLVKGQNERLCKRLEEMERLNKYIRGRMGQLKPDERAQRQLRFKEERIVFIGKELKTSEEKIKSLYDEIGRLYGLVADSGSGTLIKKLKSLGWDEVEGKNKILKINKGDVLFVENPSVYSDRAIDFLKNKVDVILCGNRAADRIKGNFLVIDSKGLDLGGDRYFAVADRKEIERLKKEANLLDHIVSSYRKGRG